MDQIVETGSGTGGETRRRRWNRNRHAGSEGISVTDVRTRKEFGELLERLRQRSGRALRDLAGEICATCTNPIGPSALGEWCRGESLPLPSRYEPFRKLLELLGVSDTAPWVDAVVRLRAARGRFGKADRPPYMGLKSFGRDDADRFFGRAELVDQAFSLLREVLGHSEGPRMLWVVGPSGAGKSSLLHAGLCPELEAAGYRCVTLEPGPRPVESLQTALAAAGGSATATDESPTGSEGWIVELPPSEEPLGAGVVFVVDQFEELLRECDDEVQRQRFLSLLGALTDAGGGCVVVAGLRIDFYGQVAEYDQLVPSLQRAQILVGPLNRAQLRESIVEPARQAGISLDEDLVSALLRDFVPSGSTNGLHDPGSLPLLAHALHETWSERATCDLMTVGDYDAAGGIGGTIETAAERVYEQLSDNEQKLVKEVFIRLVHLEGEGVVTRRALPYSELEGLRSGEVVGSRVVDLFVDARLLTAQRTTVTIVHEALLAAWPRLSTWIDDDREALRAQRRITDATQQWIDGDRDPQLLASGARLEAMQSSADRQSLCMRLSQAERDFLTASQTRVCQMEQARRRQTRRLRVLVGTAAAFAVVTSALVLVVDQARDDTAAARDEALSRQTALNAEKLRVTDPGLAAQLAVAGHAIAPTVEARSAVLSSGALPTALRHLGDDGPTALAAQPDGSLAAVSSSADGSVRLLLRRHGRVEEVAVIEVGSADSPVRGLAITPDGDTLFAGTTDGSITASDVSEPTRPRGIDASFGALSGSVERLVVSPDGKELLAGGPGESVHRWDITDPAEPQALASLPSSSAVWSMAFDSTGQRLAMSNDTGQVEIWDLSASPQRVALIQATDQPVFMVAFSPDGRWLAAGSRDTWFRVWDVSTPDSPLPVELEESKFDSWVNTTAFSPDGNYLLAGSSDLSVKIWALDGSSWTRVATLPHPTEVTNALFVDDGQTVMSTATDGTSRWWDLASALAVEVQGRTWGVSFDRTGSRLALVANNEARVWTTSEDSQRWDLLARTTVADLEGAADGFSGTGALSPDGTQLAVGTRSTGDVYLIDLTQPDQPRLAAPPLGDGTELVETVAFNPDGSALAAGGDDHLVRIWTLAADRPPSLAAIAEDPTNYVYNVAWSADGRYLAAASADSAVYLYDVADLADPKLVAKLDGLETEAYAAAFTPDGNALATAGSDGIVVLWDISDPEAPKRIGSALTGPEARIFDLAFDPTGTYLAAGTANGRTWLWDTSELQAVERLAVLGPADASIYQVEFAPDTGELMASGAEGVLFQWQPDVEKVVAAICASAGADITRREWRIYLPDNPYEPPC